MKLKVVLGLNQVRIIALGKFSRLNQTMTKCQGENRKKVGVLPNFRVIVGYPLFCMAECYGRMLRPNVLSTPYFVLF